MFFPKHPCAVIPCLTPRCGGASSLDVTYKDLTGMCTLVPPPPRLCHSRSLVSSNPTCDCRGVCQTLVFGVLGSLLLQHNKAPFFRTSFISNKVLF